MPGDDPPAPRAKAVQQQITGLASLVAYEAEKALYGAPGPASAALPVLDVRLGSARNALGAARAVVDPASDLGKGLAALAAMLD